MNCVYNYPGFTNIRYICFIHTRINNEDPIDKYIPYFIMFMLTCLSQMYFLCLHHFWKSILTKIFFVWFIITVDIFFCSAKHEFLIIFTLQELFTKLYRTLWGTKIDKCWKTVI
jgi:hypothetical protein